jgi:K+-transporting ATPase KdpF subunit
LTLFTSARRFYFLPPSRFTPLAAKNSKSNFMENIILGIISLALCGYLIFAMVRPEKF